MKTERLRGWQRVYLESIIETFASKTNKKKKSNKTADKNIKLHHVTAEMEQRGNKKKKNFEYNDAIRHFGASESILNVAPRQSFFICAISAISFLFALFLSSKLFSVIILLRDNEVWQFSNNLSN
jgi:hypothetical protein